MKAYVVFELNFDGPIDEVNTTINAMALRAATEIFVASRKVVREVHNASLNLERIDIPDTGERIEAPTI